MPGQDSILFQQGDTLPGAGEIFSRQMFEASVRAEGFISAQGGAVSIPKVIDFHPAWLFLYLLVLLGFFAWIRVYYGNIYAHTVQASTNFKVAARMFKDKSQLQNQLDNVLYTAYLLSLAYFLFLMEEKLEVVPYNLQGILLYFFNLALLLGVFLARVVVMNLLGTLFNQLALFREYLYHTFIFNKLIGITILPLLLFVLYTSGVLQTVFIWVTFSTLGVVLVMRIIRGVEFSFKKDISIFYMFLYLCALELVPLVLLYRWLAGAL
jgi:hypothetical protein